MSRFGKRLADRIIKGTSKPILAQGRYVRYPDVYIDKKNYFTFVQGNIYIKIPFKILKKKSHKSYLIYDSAVR